MKKLTYLLALLFITVYYTSCTPESVADEIEAQACCDEGEHIPPPPPPPPGGDDPNLGG